MTFKSQHFCRIGDLISFEKIWFWGPQLTSYSYNLCYNSWVSQGKYHKSKYSSPIQVIEAQNQENCSIDNQILKLKASLHTKHILDRAYDIDSHLHTQTSQESGPRHTKSPSRAHRHIVCYFSRNSSRSEGICWVRSVHSIYAF